MNKMMIAGLALFLATPALAQTAPQPAKADCCEKAECCKEQKDCCKEKAACCDKEKAGKKAGDHKGHEGHGASGHNHH